jgi:REP element-mobilizing transposase RayT
MTRPLRIEFPGSLWHITQRGNDRRPTFVEDDDRARFLELLGEAVARFRWIVSAYALMLNHYHLVVELIEDDTLSRGMQWLNGKYAQWFKRRHSRVGHLFQGRFRNFLIDKETYFLEVLRYVVLNPVRAGVVAVPEEDPWTSYRSTSGLSAAPDWLNVDGVLSHFAPERDTARRLYRCFVFDGIASKHRPWDDATSGMYLGSDEWLRRVSDFVESRLQPTEHPEPQREPHRPTMPEIVRAVAEVMAIPEERIRHGRGGILRALTAWIGCYEGHLKLRSDGHVTKLVGDCERELRASAVLRECVDRCLTTLGRKK